MKKIIFTTTGLSNPVKFEELGAYFEHPSSGITLSDFFTLEEIGNSFTFQQSITNGEIIVNDQNDNIITNVIYFIYGAPIFEIDSFSDSITYIGYGSEFESLILKITTEKNGNYLSQWSEGNQNFDKIWGDRYIYNYI